MRTTRIKKTKLISNYLFSSVEICTVPFLVPHIAVEQLGDDVQSKVNTSEQRETTCITSSIVSTGLTFAHENK
jgi:hypothetical protein